MDEARQQPAAVAAAPRQPWETIFIGPHGVRAGWRLIAFYLLYSGGDALRQMLLRVAGVHPRFEAKTFLLMEGSRLLNVLVVILIMAALERRSLATYGFPLRRAGVGKLFGEGLLWGFAALSLLLLLLRLTGTFALQGLAIHGRELAHYALLWGAVFLVVGLFEELQARSYPLYTLASGIGFWPAALLTSIAFGAIHLSNSGESKIGALGAATIAVFFCLTLRRTGSLWFAIGFHAAWDWGETFFYGTADSGLVAPGHMFNSTLRGPAWLSGGSVGPEGSVLLFVVVAILWLGVAKRFPQASFPPAAS